MAIRDTIYVVAAMISKRDGSNILTFLVQSWSVGTRTEAIGSAMEFVAENKPGFSVDQYLVTEITGVDLEALPTGTAHPSRED